MQYNSLEGSLPTEFGLLTSLKTANFNSNMLSGSIPNLSTIKKLQSLLLSRNQFSGPIPDDLPSSLGESYTIDVLDTPKFHARSLKAHELAFLD